MHRGVRGAERGKTHAPQGARVDFGQDIYKKGVVWGSHTSTVHPPASQVSPLDFYVDKKKMILGPIYSC